MEDTLRSLAVQIQTFHVSPEDNYRPTQSALYEKRSHRRIFFGVPHIVILDELDNICTGVVTMKAEDKVLDIHAIDDKLVDPSVLLTCPISLLNDSGTVFIDIKTVIWS